MSKELLKVIAGLECCDECKCGSCPYNDGRILGVKCIEDLMRDALRILREVSEDGLY